MTKQEQFVRKLLGVPENWDKHNMQLPRYSLTDLEDAAEQLADAQVVEYRDRLLTVMEFTGTITEEDIHACFAFTTQY
jgi:hypothetical protein